MEQVSNQTQSMIATLISQVEVIVNRAFDNPYINTAIKVFIGLYAALSAPALPRVLLPLMDNILVRIAGAFVIVLIALRDPSIALLVAFAFMVTLQVANSMRLYNADLSFAAPGELSWLPSSKSATINQGSSAVPLMPHHSNVDPKDVAIGMAARPSAGLEAFNPNQEPVGTVGFVMGAPLGMEGFENPADSGVAPEEDQENVAEEDKDELKKAAEYFGRYQNNHLRK